MYDLVLKFISNFQTGASRKVPSVDDQYVPLCNLQCGIALYYSFMAKLYSFLLPSPLVTPTEEKKLI